MSIRKSLLVLPVALLSIGATINASAKTKHYISKITHVKVTPQRVYGHTTRGANVTVLNGKKSLGHAKANKKGNFTIKTKKNLKKVNFKLKAAKKGYVSRTATYKAKSVKKNKLIKQAKLPKQNPKVTKPNSKVFVSVTKVNPNNKNQQIQAAKDRLAQAQANYDAAKAHYDQNQLDIRLAQEEIDNITAGYIKFGWELNPNDKNIAQDKAIISEVETELVQTQATLNQATQELNDAKASLSALQ